MNGKYAIPNYYLGFESVPCKEPCRKPVCAGDKRPGGRNRAAAENVRDTDGSTHLLYRNPHGSGWGFTENSIQHIHHSVLVGRLSRGKCCGHLLFRLLQIGEGNRKGPFQPFQIAAAEKVSAACG